jgi:hypothetical protein
MPATAAQFAALLTAEAQVTTDQATLLADTTTQTTAQSTFASGLTPGQVVVFIPTPPDGTVSIITQDTSAQGFTVTTATVLS